MKTPLNPLPWETFDSAGNITIESSHPFGEDCVCMELYKQDSEYLVQACNNFPKAIELIQECRDFINMIPNDRGGVNHYEILKRVDEFLKEIES